MKKVVKQAIDLANKIEAEYMKLDPNKSEIIFDQFHDNMQIQKDCAWQEVDEIEMYAEKKETEQYIQSGIDNLTKTLAYCKAITKLQKQAEAVPECIYG